MLFPSYVPCRQRATIDRQQKSKFTRLDTILVRDNNNNTTSRSNGNYVIEHISIMIEHVRVSFRFFVLALVLIVFANSFLDFPY
jgi:hypothetical protein